MSPHEAKPLQLLDFKIVQEPLNGLLRNMDMDLLRRIRELQASGRVDEHRQLTLLLVMLRFAKNTYEAVGFLMSDLDEDSKRLPRFVVVLPPINRQIADLWFTLIYVMDDFDARSLAHELCSYSELCEEIERNRERFGPDPEWQPWREDMQELKELMESQLPITSEQKANPTPLGFWPTPFRMLNSRRRANRLSNFFTMFFITKYRPKRT